MTDRSNIARFWPDESLEPATIYPMTLYYSAAAAFNKHHCVHQIATTRRDREEKHQPGNRRIERDRRPVTTKTRSS